MRWRARTSMLSLAFALQAFHPFPAGAAIFSGTVSSTIGLPLDSALVIWKENPAAHVLTDAQGRFTLNTEMLALRPPRERGAAGDRVGAGSRAWRGYAWERDGETFLHDLAGRVRERLGADAGPGGTLGARKEAAGFTLVVSKDGYRSAESLRNDGVTGMTVVLDYLDPRVRALEDYRKNYLPSAVAPAELGWTGAVAGCNAGAISDAAQAKTLVRLNYFRRLAGVPPVVFDPALNAKAQKAALMMMANDTLSHEPPATWACYSADGAFGAGHSNLAYLPATDALTDYMRDPGPTNYVLGHRRWILYPKTQVMGHGSTPTFDALYNVTDFPATYPAGLGPFQAWPPSGFVPAPLAFPRWSFSVPQADFSSAKVEMTGPNGKPVALMQLAYTPLYGEPTLGWEPQGIDTGSKTDAAYAVHVTGVKNAPQTAYSYTVTLIQP